MESKKNRYPRGYWTYERCKELVSKCKTLNELITKHYTAYTIIIKKWAELKNIFEPSQKPFNYWNYETCKEESLKYKTRTEFQKKSNNSYRTSLKNKWLNEFYG